MVVVPMLVAGVLSAYWVSHRFERSRERWIRTAAEIDEDSLQASRRNGQLFAEVLADLWRQDMAARPMERFAVPPELRPMMEQLGISLIQVYTVQRQLAYSSPPAQMVSPWAPGQTQAMLKLRSGQQALLATVAIRPVPRRGQTRYYLVAGTLLDGAYLARLSQRSGLDARLFYPDGPQEQTFHDAAGATAIELPAEAFERFKTREGYYSERAEGGAYRGLYTPLLDPAGRVEAVLFSGLKRHGSNEVVSPLKLSLAIVLFGLLIGAVTRLALTRLLVKPIERLRNGVLQLAAQDFCVTLPDSSNDELGDLARSFNAMAARLREARDEEHRQFQMDKLTALGELCLALAHEIRNPISVINTACSLLEATRQDPDKQAGLAQMVREETGRLNRLLKDFQQLSPSRRPQISTFDPVQPLDRAIRLALAARDDIRVERHIHHGGTTVNADAELMQQAWSNLLSNALEAIGDRAGSLRVTTLVERGEVVVALEDTGPGIPAELIPRLFEPFFTTKERGTGLGLTLAHRLVEANGGRIELQAAQGSGARFAMRFPVDVTEE